MKLSAVMLAGGYGCFHGPKMQKISKVLAHLDGKPMFSRIVDQLISTKLFSRYYVVTNQDYHEQIALALRGHPEIRYVTQTHRIGSAGAAKLALDLMEPDEQHALIQYGDMGFIELETYRCLVERHLYHDRPRLTLATIPYVPGTPVEKYGRFIYGEHGELLGTVDDPLCVPRGKFVQANKANPSLYVANVGWLKQRIPRLRPVDKGDGFPKERLMQGLISAARQRGDRVACVHFSDYEQFHGVNTLEELRQARRLFAARIQHREPIAA